MRLPPNAADNRCDDGHGNQDDEQARYQRATVFGMHPPSMPASRVTAADPVPVPYGRLVLIECGDLNLPCERTV